MEEVEVVARQTGDRMITPHDESARLGVKKGGKLRWVGSKLHAAETVPERAGDVSFVVDLNMTPANVPDIAETLPSQDRLAKREFEPPRFFVDAGYVSGKAVARSRRNTRSELHARGFSPISRGPLVFDGAPSKDP